MNFEHRDTLLDRSKKGTSCKEDEPTKKLADAIQMSKSTIARIESGVAVPNLRTLQLIADALDTPLTIQPDRRELETIR
ncbi:hypothetical protein GCM10020331_010320 [Ectobacillus funiculus]